MGEIMTVTVIRRPIIAESELERSRVALFPIMSVIKMSIIVLYCNVAKIAVRLKGNLKETDMI